MKRKQKNVFSKSSPMSWVIFGFLLLDVTLLMFLYIWSFYTSFKKPFEFMQNQLWPTWPWQWSFENYVRAFSLFESEVLTPQGLYIIGLPTMLYNTICRCVIAVGIGTTVKWIMSYLLGRFTGLHVTIIMNMFIFLMMIPIIGSTAAMLRFYKGLGVYDTWWYPIIMAIPFFDYNFLILQAFVRGVGSTTIEAAMIDGAGNFRVMWQIVFPQTFNAYLIMALNTLIATWNDYMTTVVWMPSYPTLSYGVYEFSVSTTTGASLPPVQMAGSMILALPMIMVFVIFKEKILGGITFALTK